MKNEMKTLRIRLLVFWIRVKKKAHMIRLCALLRLVGYRYKGRNIVNKIVKE